MAVKPAKGLGLAGASQWLAGYINHEHLEQKSKRNWFCNHVIVDSRGKF